MDSLTKYSFSVVKMKCGGCVSAIEAALNELAETEIIEVSLENKMAIVKSTKDANEIAKIITDSGFPATLINS